MAYAPLAADVTEFTLQPVTVLTLQPVAVFTADLVYPRHILDWRAPYLQIRDGTGRVWTSGLAVAAEQDVASSPTLWRWTLDDGAVWVARFTSGCASCSGSAPRRRTPDDSGDFRLAT